MTKKLRIFMRLKSTRSRGKNFLRKIKQDLVMACHIRIILPLEKAKKQGEMPLTRLSPIPSLNSTFCNGMGLSLVNGISPCFYSFFERWNNSNVTGHH